MEDIKQLKDEFEKCFEYMQSLVNKSFDLIKREPASKEETVNLWKHYISRFTSFTFKTGEKYNNKDIIKAITKALIFGK